MELEEGRGEGTLLDRYSCYVRLERRSRLGVEAPRVVDRQTQRKVLVHKVSGLLDVLGAVGVGGVGGGGAAVLRRRDHRLARLEDVEAFSSNSEFS